jgi:hypothetical protein
VSKRRIRQWRARREDAALVDRINTAPPRHDNHRPVEDVIDIGFWSLPKDVIEELEGHSGLT